MAQHKESIRTRGAFATVTHARLRADQGDVDGARSLLRALLTVEPGHTEAERLLDSLTTQVQRPRHEPEDEVAAPPAPATAAELSSSFRDVLNPLGRRRDRRIGRLRELADRIARHRGGKR